MKNKFLSALTTMMIGASLIAGCSFPAMAESSTEAAAEGSAEAVSGLPAKDLAGNDISLPEEVNTIVAMSPSSTRLLIDLGLSDRIVACDTYSFLYYGDSLKADIPQFDMMTPDNEAIVALDPDLILTTGMSYASGDDVYAAVRESGVCIADIPSASSLAEVADSINFIGACTGTSDIAAEIVSEMNDTIDSVKAVGDTIPEDQKKSVLYMLNTPTADSPSIYSAGKGTYIDEMITDIGAVNAASSDEQWPSLTEEAAVAADPDVILTSDTYTENVVDTILGLEGWDNVKAVADKNVYLMNYSNELNQPNQHLVSAMIEMAKDIYPDVYADIADPFAESAEPQTEAAD